MAAEATFLIRAVDSTKSAFASVQNNLDKLKNESQLAGGFLKKAFDFKQLGMGLAVAAGASLVSIVDKALAQLDEFIKRSETARIGTIAAATDAEKIYAAGAFERMSMEEQLAGMKQGEINAKETLVRLEKDQTVATRSFWVATKNGFMVLHQEKYRDLNLTKEQQKEYDETIVKIAQLTEAQKKLSLTIGNKKKTEDEKKAKEDALITQEFENRVMANVIENMERELGAMKKVNDEYDKSVEKKQKDKELLEKDALAMRMLINPSIQYEQTLKRIGEAFDKHLLTQPEKIALINRAISDLADVMNKPLDKLRLDMFDGMDELYDKTHQVTNVANDMGFAFASAFESAVLNGEKAGNAMKALGRDILQVFLRLAVTNQIINAIFGASGLGLGGKGFQPLPTIGTRANGGPVSAGSPYLVGERGPELFVPKGSGTVMPNGAGGTSVNITYNIASGVSRSDLAPILEQQRKLLKAEIPDMVRRGGGYRAAFA